MYSCPSKGRQPLDGAVGLEGWESRFGPADKCWSHSLLSFLTSQVSVGTWGCSRKRMVCLQFVCSLLRTKLLSLQVFQKRSPDKCLLFIHISSPNNFLFSSFRTLPHTSEQREKKQAVNIGIFYQIFSFFSSSKCVSFETQQSHVLPGPMIWVFQWKACRCECWWLQFKEAGTKLCGRVVSEGLGLLVRRHLFEIRMCQIFLALYSTSDPS